MRERIKKAFLYVAGTVLFIVWDGCKRLRGWWRRR